MWVHQGEVLQSDGRQDSLSQMGHIEHLLFGVGRQSWVSWAPISLGPKGHNGAGLSGQD